MNLGYSRRDADSLIGKRFETTELLTRVPRHTRGRVVEAIDAGDHWNLLIEWELHGVRQTGWYNKTEVQSYMRPVSE